MLSEPVRECLINVISSLMLMVHLKQNRIISKDVLLQQVEDHKEYDIV